jgi:hypothetical protein
MTRFAILMLAGFAMVAGPAVAGNGTVSIVPFSAYYGERNLSVTGGNSPIALPHHIGCPKLTGKSVESEIQKICAPGKAYYTSIGQASGNNCGYNVFSGVCVTVTP